MRLLVISDSHQTSLSSLDVSKYDAVFHCGDYGKSLPFLQQPHIYFVKGNCDNIGDNSYLLQLFGKRIFLTHGHHENVKYSLDNLIYRALEQKAEICMFGHLHQVLFFQEEGITFINPGAYPNSYIEITETEIIIFKNQTKKTIPYRW